MTEIRIFIQIVFFFALFFCILRRETGNQQCILTGKWKMIHFGNEINSQKIDSTNVRQTISFSFGSLGFCLFCNLITLVFYRIMASHCAIFQCEWKTKFQQWRNLVHICIISTDSFEYSGYKKINTKWNKKQRRIQTH